jgi:DNA-binding transcriptional ArsR family regulator
MKELANLLGAVAHPHRLRILEELKGREMDVGSIQQILGISHSSVSQNLSVLRAHRLVVERREGRRVVYCLRQQELAGWLRIGLKFLEGDLQYSEEIRNALDGVRREWAGEQAHASISTRR